LSKQKILYKVEGSEKIGMGHVFRSFFLLQKLKKKYDVIIFTENKSKSEEFFKKKHFKLITYSKINQYKIFKKFIINLKIDKFINDTIFIDKKIYTFLKQSSCKCYFLDTKNIKANKMIYCINTFIKTKQKHINYYFGLKYIIKDPSLRVKKNYKLDKSVRVLLHFGGTDERRLNIKLIDILYEVKNIKRLTIILGPALTYNPNKIYQNLKKFKSNFKVHNYPKKLSTIYNRSDLAITTGGNTMFNFCYMNQKNISISANKLEEINCKKMQNLNLTNYYGHYTDINKKKFIQFYNKTLLENKKNKIKLIVDGVKEISKIIDKK
jgi:spore coat polysaccharide biosynthesis predicted glycosyltransferase SpsG